MHRLKKVTNFRQDYHDGQIVTYRRDEPVSTGDADPSVGTVRTDPRCPGQRDHVQFYGALNLRNRHESVLSRLAMNSVKMAAFPRDLLASYPGQPLPLWDRASWHKGQPVPEVLATHPLVETMFFSACRR